MSKPETWEQVVDTWRKHAVARCYIANPGGAYDPAPLEHLDMPVSAMPAVGDLIFDGPARRASDHVYRVVARHFQPDGYRVALIVEEVEHPAVSPFTV